MKKSPFPGMDPYLERRWGDVHTRLCTYVSAALQPNLPPGLRARAQEDVLLESDDSSDLRYFEPDVSIVETDPSYESPPKSSEAVAVQPLKVTLMTFPKRQRWVEILDTASGNRVVTAIEILSPGNKASGKLNQKYIEKVTEYLGAGANVVEIDLLRSSRERLMVTSERIQAKRRADYYVCTAKAMRPNHWWVYPMPLRLPLPTVMIPCRESDNDVPLELQPIIDRIYLEGGHDDLDYSEPPEPPFSNVDAEWAASLIKSRKALP
jgi:hypothetical protein